MPIAVTQVIYSDETGFVFSELTGPTMEEIREDLRRNPPPTHTPSDDDDGWGPFGPPDSDTGGSYGFFGDDD